jgi:TonB family protein
MKNPFLFFLIILSLATTSQNFTFERIGGKAEPISQKKLRETMLVTDFIPNYSTVYNSFMEYTFVELTANVDGKDLSITAPNQNLTVSQRKMLNAVDVGTEVRIKMKFRFKNKDQSSSEIRDMDYSLVATPEVAAEFPGGSDEMTKFLQTNILDKLSEDAKTEISRAAVSFIVDENGQISKVKMIRTSANEELDIQLLEAVNKMPAWKPAQKTNGTTVRQEIAFRIGSGGC